jgi:flavin reductase (DIM6/NTAB) family NADH-FMN oxidoreductase RutF
MFYETAKNDHGLAYNPYKSIVVPRPIGWITTLDTEGEINLAPYSQFNNLGYDPPYVMFSSGSRSGDGGPKDSARNALLTGEFVCNMATWDLRDQINTTAQMVAPDVDEAELAGLEMVASNMVAPPRVKASPVHLECKYHTTLTLPGNSVDNIVYVVVGEVLGVHISDDVITDEGKIDILKCRPLARMGYFDYTSVESVFEIAPSGPDIEKIRRGLEGRARGKYFGEEDAAE